MKTINPAEHYMVIKLASDVGIGDVIYSFSDDILFLVFDIDKSKRQVIKDAVHCAIMILLDTVYLEKGELLPWNLGPWNLHNNDYVKFN